MDPDGGGVSRESKPSEFELERLAPRTEIDMLSTNLAGENISLADGSLSFSVTDISVPTNMGVPVEITRSYNRLSGKNEKQASAFSDWELSLPRITATAIKGDHRWTPNYNTSTACLDALNPGPIAAARGQVVEQHEYWNGAELIIPGQGGGKLMYGNPASNINANSQYQTTDHMLIDCASDSNGEYFVVRTPNGLTYTLKQRRIIKGVPLIRSNKSAQRNKIFYLVSEIKDRFNNRLTYHYQGNGLLSNVRYIPASSGIAEELLYITYVGERISQVNSFGRRWQYQYQGQNLYKVILPDNRFWLYDFPTFSNFAPQIVPRIGSDIASEFCQYQVLGQSVSAPARITHPYGTVVDFYYALQVNGRTEVPASEMNQDLNKAPTYNVNICYGNLAITKKRLTLPNGTTYNWKYEYSNNKGHWNLKNWNRIKWRSDPNAYKSFSHSSAATYGSNKSSACNAMFECSTIPSDLGYEKFDLRVLKITEPTGDFTQHYISKRWDETDGKVVATQWKNSNGDVLKTVKKHYTASAIYGNPQMHDGIYTTNLMTISQKALLTRSEIIENTDSYSIEYDDFNVYGKPQKIIESNSLPNSTSKYTRQLYQHDTNNWILNQPTITEIGVNGYSYTRVNENSYYSGTHTHYASKLYQQKLFNVWQKRITQYTVEGNIQRIEYNSPLTFSSGKRYVKFSNYKRGIAQNVQVPARYSSAVISLSRTVDNNGWVTKVTDFEGNSTRYGYDNIGRIRYIDPVDSAWSDTLFSWTNQNQPTRTVSRCTLNSSKTACSNAITLQTTTLFDGLLRPVQVITTDVANNNNIYQNMKYNAYNKKIFSSYLSTNPNESLGTYFDFDTLQRPVKTRLSDGRFSTIAYLAGNKIQKKDFKGHITTTDYLAYGSPSYSTAIRIVSPENITTNIAVNIFGEVSTITQSGAHKNSTITQTETRLYNNAHQLCMVKRNDVGNRYYYYNAIGEVLWEAHGVSGTSCSNPNATNTQKITYTYDNLGNKYKINYADSTPDITYSLDKNGDVTKLIAGSVIQEYNINSARLVDSESLHIDNKIFTLAYKYTPLAALKQLTYPSGRIVPFRPNGFGQATKAGSYASNAQYHPNGTLKSLTYGNGLVYNLTQDTQQRPYNLTVSKASSHRLYQRYTYDDNNNLDYIYDYTNRSYDIDLAYDDLDRLVYAKGGWGNGSVVYDSLGNITNKTMGNQALTYHYNLALNKLTSVSGAKAYRFSYDSRGNVTNNGRYSLAFNQANQLISAKGNSYHYDGYNRLVKKTASGNTTYTMYNQRGALFYREESNGVKTDYIRLGSTLIAKDNTPINTASVATLPSSAPTVNGSFSKKDWRGEHFTVNWQSNEQSNITHFELYQRGEAVIPPPNCEPIFLSRKVGIEAALPPQQCNQNRTFKITGEWVRTYSGAGLSTVIFASTSMVDVKIRACNSLGCGPYSLIKSLSSAW